MKAKATAGSQGRSKAEAPAPSKRARLASALERIGLLDRLLWLRGRVDSRSILLLAYHRIGRSDAVGELDPGVIDVDPELFAEQLAVVNAHGTVLPLSDLNRYVDGKPLPPNPVVVTFDDGYRDNLEVAVPILRRFGVPATFFIPTAFPDAGRLFFWDRISLVLRRTQRERVVVDYPKRIEFEPRADPEAAAVRLTVALKLTQNLDLPRLWEELERATGVTLGASEERTIAEKNILGWSGVKALVAAGMQVESHSHEHLVLNNLTPERAQKDLAHSRAMLRDIVGTTSSAVAYPVGYELRGASRKAAELAGFSFGFTANTGICHLDRLDRFNVPRVGMDPKSNAAMHKLLLLLGDRSTPPPGPMATAFE